MEFLKTSLDGVILIKPQIFPDHRGLFFESYSEEKFSKNLENVRFVQDNFSYSNKNVLRGLHFQRNKPQGKLISCLSGEIYDVAVNINKASNQYGEFFATKLSDKNYHQLWIPPGFAHGFCVLSDYAKVMYKCTELYLPNSQAGILWDDVNLNIDWPISNPIISEKDKMNIKFREL